MVQKALNKAKEAWMSSVIAAANTHKVRAFKFATPSTDNVAIVSSTNATPIVVTFSAVPGAWAIGDYVLVRGHLVNTNANNYWQISALTGTTITLKTVPPQSGTALNSVGNGAGAATGTVFNLSQVSTSGTIPAASSGATDQTLASVTDVNGFFNSATPVTFNGVTGLEVIDALGVFQSTGTDRVHFITDGKQLVRLTQTATAVTTVNVEPLYAAIASGVVLTFTNGSSGTTSGVTAAAATQVVFTVAQTIPQGHYAEAPISGWGLPATMGSGATNVQFNIDAVNGWYQI